MIRTSFARLPVHSRNTSRGEAARNLHLRRRDHECGPRRVETRLGAAIRMGFFSLIVMMPLTTSAESHGKATSNENASAWLEAMAIPELAQELRQSGVPAEEVATALRALRGTRGPGEAGMASRRTAAILRAEVEAARTGGPADGFGAIVKAKVDEGLRGEDLALAIRSDREERRSERAAQSGAAGERREQRTAVQGKPTTPRPAAAGRPSDSRGITTKRGATAEPSGGRRQVAPPGRGASTDQAGRRGTPDRASGTGEQQSGEGRTERAPQRR